MSSELLQLHSTQGLFSAQLEWVSGSDKTYAVAEISPLPKNNNQDTFSVTKEMLAFQRYILTVRDVLAEKHNLSGEQAPCFLIIPLAPLWNVALRALLSNDPKTQESFATLQALSNQFMRIFLETNVPPLGFGVMAKIEGRDQFKKIIPVRNAQTARHHIGRA